METDFVDWLTKRIPADPRLEVPPGDDAAVLRPPALRRTVVTVDMLTEGVDFILGPACPPAAVGHKAVGVSLSDLAAMGSRPEAVFVAVCLPRSGGAAIARGLLEGVERLVAEHGCVLAGGDTNAWDGPLVVSVTALGSVPPGGPGGATAPAPATCSSSRAPAAAACLAVTSPCGRGAARRCGSPPTTTSTPPSTSATGCPSTWRGSRRPAVSGPRCDSPTFRSMTMPGG